MILDGWFVGSQSVLVSCCWTLTSVKMRSCPFLFCMATHLNDICGLWVDCG